MADGTRGAPRSVHAAALLLLTPGHLVGPSGQTCLAPRGWTSVPILTLNPQRQLRARWGGHLTPQRCQWSQETLPQAVGSEARERGPSPGSRITYAESLPGL